LCPLPLWRAALRSSRSPPPRSGSLHQRSKNSARSIATTSPAASSPPPESSALSHTPCGAAPYLITSIIDEGVNSFAVSTALIATCAKNYGMRKNRYSAYSICAYFRLLSLAQNKIQVSRKSDRCRPMCKPTDYSRKISGDSRWSLIIICKTRK